MKTSLTGYKSNSKDKNEPLLEIPSNQITMEGISFPIVSVLDDGSFKVMKPDENYSFNTKSVIEIPMKKNKKQKGGLIKDFESYLSSLEEEDQDQVIDYIESLGSDEQEMFLKGGMTVWKKYQQGGMTPIEVEHDETILNPNGELYGFKGKTHAQGGIDILAEGGSKIFSEFSKAPKELIKTVLGKETKKKMSYADLSKKFDTTKWSKILQNPDSDQYEKETAKLKMSGNLAMLETIFQTQEEEKIRSEKGKMQKGGQVNVSTQWDRTFPDIDTKAFWDNYYENVPDLPPFVRRDKKDETTIYHGLLGTHYMPQEGTNATGAFFNLDKTLPPASKTLDVVDPNKTSVAPLPSKTSSVRTKTSTPSNQPAPQQRTSTDSLNPIPSLAIPTSVKSTTPPSNSFNRTSGSSQTISQKTETESKNPFGIGHKLAGTILDVGLALGDSLTVQNPQYRDLRKSPLFSRFVDFDDKEAGRNLALNIQQIQNSNMPEEVKQARIANLNAQYQDHTAKVAYGNAQRYETKINQDTEKLQTYINNNIDQHFQDVERYNQQKAKVDYLKDQFHAQQKSRVVNSIRNYLDYVEETRIKNQLNSENYRVNPISGRIDFLGNKQDALKKKEMEMQQYAQNAVPVKNLPNGAVLAKTPQGVEIIIDSTGKATVVKG